MQSKTVSSHEDKFLRSRVFHFFPGENRPNYKRRGEANASPRLLSNINLFDGPCSVCCYNNDCRASIRRNLAAIVSNLIYQKAQNHRVSVLSN